MSIPQQNAEATDPDRWHATEEPSGRRGGGGFDRAQPQDLDAEQAVLGGMLLSKDAIEDVLTGAKLKARDFYRPAHETVFRAILALFGKGEPADPITVAGYLRESGELTQVGGTPALHTLVEAVPTAANAEYYAEFVKATALKRRLVQAGTRIVQLGYEDGEAKAAIDAAGAELFQVSDENADEDMVLIGEDDDDEIDYLEELGRRGEGLIGVPTGFADLDLLTNGFQPGQFIIVAARPAMGKSTLAVDFVRACSVDNDIPTAFFSLEMERREIKHRIWSATGKIALHHLKSGQLTDDDWTRLREATPLTKRAPLHLDASPNLTMTDIRAKARRLVQKHGVRMIVIDYIQLMTLGGRTPETRQQEVSGLSRNLKLLAKELGVPVVGLSQLNRGPEQRTDKKPMVSDLRESGSLEQDADIVILLHREDQYEKESPRAGEADLIVAKHRNGATTTITVAAQLHYSRFVDMGAN
ncbi:replicative DNA helicase [Streptomyces sp. H10-C2]|uniref:replicative DNA helicase n=1 Tax=unclassified Streptomyces TaxID=2593676 RepID=UPI0024BB32A5|nr:MULTISPECIES: replicative DNA helicase [unclassified Streptomyces]MDJ0346357.1 replicative DNA helicase [Streptomyces sp. PH10-H1]MDJ0374953.1 replicative DNA helicase [Streptomyces sp. H10-C2]